MGARHGPRGSRQGSGQLEPAPRGGGMLGGGRPNSINIMITCSNASNTYNINNNSTTNIDDTISTNSINNRYYIY
jgi:hypothetical protein